MQFADGELAENDDGAYYAIQDANYNVTAITDDGGAVKERYQYSPYGEVTFLEDYFDVKGSQITNYGNTHLYTGRERDFETGLQLNRHRFYAAHLGRWVNRDPVEYAFSWSLYQYVRSTPLSLLDPFGLKDYKLGNEDPQVRRDPGAGEWGSDSNWFDNWLQERLIDVAKELFRNWPDARAHLAHYLGNSGDDYTIRLRNMINEVPSAKLAYDAELAEAKAFVEGLEPGTYEITSGSVSSARNPKDESGNWFYAVGGYQYWGKGTATVECDESSKNSYTLKFEYKFFDRYNWDTGKAVTIGPIKITDKFMGDLHRAGVAKEFDMFGTVSETVQWGGVTTPPTGPPPGGGRR